MDFDGVIKDSLEVKSDAYQKLFKSFGKEVTKKVRIHHEKNGGVCRFDKIALYLSWSKVESDEKLLTKYLTKFSNLVEKKVIESNWVPGALDFLKVNSKKSILFIVTATPQKEIENIINKLNISQYFKYVIGSPTSKI